MRVRWLRRVLLNLDEEASYIAADDPVAARLVVARVLDAVAQCEDPPGLGRPGRAPKTRDLLVATTHYVLPYRVKRETVEILRVFYSTRRLPKRW